MSEKNVYEISVRFTDGTSNVHAFIESENDKGAVDYYLRVIDETREVGSFGPFLRSREVDVFDLEHEAKILREDGTSITAEELIDEMTA